MAAASRNNSIWSKEDGSKFDTPQTASPDTRSEVAVDKEEHAPKYGRIIGGKFIEESQEDAQSSEYGPLQKIEGVDIPLTLTENVHENDRDYVVLYFRPGDPECPFNWSPWYKGMLSTLLCLMTLFIGLATTAYSSGIDSMVADLNSTSEIGQLGLFTFNAACALAPLFLAPFCELVGRKVIYVGGYLCFSLLFIGLALGKNITTIIILRLLLGLFGCIGTILVGGTFDDMYEPAHRGQPMACFAYVAILGTVGAPIYAGFIDQSIGWRWIEGVQGIANVPLLIAVAIFFRETRGGVTLHKRAKMLRKSTGDDRYVNLEEIETPGLKELLKASSVKAIQMLVTEPVVLAFGLFIGFSWFVVFLFLSVIPITFSEKRGWSEGVSGLPYIALVIGTTLGYIGHNFQMRYYNKLQADPNHRIVPEDRLYGAMYMAIFMPIGLFIYSFTQYGYINFMGPCIGLVLIAIGIYAIFESCYSYTADCFVLDSSSAIAGQGFLRNMLGAVSPLFASQFFHNVGSQYAGLILSLVGVVLSLIPFVAFKFGHRLRARSKRAKVY